MMIWIFDVGSEKRRSHSESRGDHFGVLFSNRGFTVLKEITRWKELDSNIELSAKVNVVRSFVRFIHGHW